MLTIKESRQRRLHWLAVAGLLGLSLVLAVSSLLQDSATFDEPFHLTAGYSFLRMGDFRLSPDHPPLARLWAAWPLLLTNCPWPPADDPGWAAADVVPLSNQWLFQLADGQRLVVIGRLMIVILLAGTLLATYGLGRTLGGRGAGLLAMTLAGLCPNLLAHGRLVTTDLPVTLFSALTLLTIARLWQRVSWLRLLAAAGSLAAVSVTKMSWPLLLPAVAVMAGWSIWSRQPMAVAAPRGQKDQPDTAGTRPIGRARERATIVLGTGVALALATWAGIWTCYGWHGSLVAPLPADASPEMQAQQEKTVARLQADWQICFVNPDNTPRRGLMPLLLRTAADWGALPEAYLFGLARTMHYTSARRAYLCGQYSDEGWASYFPICFAIKTPVAAILLIAAGLVTLAVNRGAVRDRRLLAGLLAFVLVYVAYLINGRVNIGARHLLPVYPALYAIAGLSAAWLAQRWGRWLTNAAVAWLAVANFVAYPNYLAYFNELVGGSSRGYRYLADSNLDWGQDLLRLADYARRHPDEQIKLAYFGSAVPTRYLPCESLPSYFEFLPRAELTAGTYVACATQLLGVYDLEIRRDYWTPAHLAALAALDRIARSSPEPDDSPLQLARRAEAQAEAVELRYRLLLSRLQARRPDERLGGSVFIYRLSDADVTALSRP